MKLSFPYKGRGILWQFDSTMPGTWVGHTTLTFGLLVVGIVAGAFMNEATFGGLVGASIGLAFFVDREESDKKRKVQAGTYDERARLDKVGDILGPATVYATALAMAIGGFFS